jgi:putative ABC transport system permease protein
MAWILTAAIQLRAFGWSMPLSLGSGPYLIALMTGLGAALLASVLPARRASLENPAPQLRED